MSRALSCLISSKVHAQASTYYYSTARSKSRLNMFVPLEALRNANNSVGSELQIRFAFRSLQASRLS